MVNDDGKESHGRIGTPSLLCIAMEFGEKIWM